MGFKRVIRGLSEGYQSVILQIFPGLGVLNILDSVCRIAAHGPMAFKNLIITFETTLCLEKRSDYISLKRTLLLLCVFSVVGECRIYNVS